MWIGGRKRESHWQQRGKKKKKKAKLLILLAYVGNCCTSRAPTLPLAIPPRNYGREMQPILQYTRSLHMCGLCPSVEWQCCNFEGTECNANYIVPSDAALLKQFPRKYIRKMQPKHHKNRIKENFLLVFLCLCVFFFLQSIALWLGQML